jgi:hypothetical protein
MEGRDRDRPVTQILYPVELYEIPSGANIPNSPKSQIDDQDITNRTAIDSKSQLPTESPRDLIRAISGHVKGYPERPPKKSITKQPPRLPLKVNTSVASLGHTLAGLPSSPLTIKRQSPWTTYTSIRPIFRGGEVIAAQAVDVPHQTVCVKEITAVHLSDIKELARPRHPNLVALFEVYQTGSALYAITEYTVVSLDQIIAIPHRLEEAHVSTICSHVSQYPFPSIEYVLIFIDLSRHETSLKIRPRRQMAQHSRYLIFRRWEC